MEVLLEKILDKKNLMKLSDQFIIIKNEKLKNWIAVSFYSLSDKLYLTTVSQDEEKRFPNECIVIQDELYLILDPDKKDYERMLLLKVNSEENVLQIKEVITPTITTGKFEIIYN